MDRRPRRRKVRLSPRPGSRLDLFMRGELTVDDLTEEELLTGILNDKNGERSGRPANQIPREFHQAVVRRVIEIGEGKMQSAYLEAAEQIIEVALGEVERTEHKEFDNGRLISSDSRSYDPVVLKAAQYVFERVGGKTPDVVAATVTVSKWEGAADVASNVFEADAGMARISSEAAGLTASSGVTGNGAHD